MPFEYPIRTRYVETGQDGIIHHSSYVVYLEVARIEFLKTIGFDVNELEKMKIYCPVVDLSLKYLKPLYSLEDIVVQVHAGTFSKVRFSLTYHILRQGECVTRGEVSHCFLNESFKPIPLPHAFVEQFKRLLTEKQ